MLARCKDCNRLLGFLGIFGQCYFCDVCGNMMCESCVNTHNELDYCENCFKLKKLLFKIKKLIPTFEVWQD